MADLSYADSVVKKIKLPGSYSVEVSPEGDRLVSLGRSVVMVDTIGRKRLWTSHPVSNASTADFSPDGTKVAIKNTSGRIVVVDTETSELTSDLNNQKDGEGAHALFSPCGQYLVDGSWAGKITVRDWSTGDRTVTLSYPGESINRASRCSQRQKWLFHHQPITRPGENDPEPSYATLHEWPLTGAITRIKLNLYRVYGLSLSPDAKHIALVGLLDRGSAETLFILTSEGVVIQFVRLDTKSFKSLRWSNDGKFIGVADTACARVFRVADLAVVSRHEGEYISDIGLDPKDEFIAYGDWKQGLILYNESDELQ